MNRLFSVLVFSFLTGTVLSQNISHRKVFVHPAPVVVNRSPVIVHKGPVFVNRPVYYPYRNVNFRFTGGYFYRPFYHPYGAYWRIVPPPIGLRVSMLPYGYRPIYAGPSLYYYYNGAYYRRYNDNGYEVVDPPMDATLSSLPKGAKSVLVNGEQFYELNGTYYKQTTNGSGRTVYVVTGKNGEINNSVSPDQENFTPQQGDIVDELPENYKTIKLNDEIYYVGPGDTYYQSIEQDGVTRFQVVGKPQADIRD